MKPKQIRACILSDTKGFNKLLISEYQTNIISLISACGNITSNKLSEMGEMSHSMAMYHLYHLYKKGYLNRSPKYHSKAWVYQINKELTNEI